MAPWTKWTVQHGLGLRRAPNQSLGVVLPLVRAVFKLSPEEEEGSSRAPPESSSGNGLTTPGFLGSLEGVGVSCKRYLLLVGLPQRETQFGGIFLRNPDKGFRLCSLEGVWRVPPARRKSSKDATLAWRYLGLEIGKRTIVLQKLEIKAKIKTLIDVHQLCGALNCVRPWLGLTTEDLTPLFNLLEGGEELSSPRELTPEAKEALEKVQHLMSTRQAHRCDPDLPFKFIIMGKLPHLHGVIFQWRNNIKKNQGREDPLLIIEWVFLSHQRSKRMTRPQELEAELIWKARVRIRELAGCDFECIHIPIGLRSGQITKAMLEHLLQENEALQFALDSFTGQISIHRPAHKIFNQDAKFTLSLKSIQSRKPLEALTVFTGASGRSHKSVMTWKDPQTQHWEADVAEVEGSPQVAELAAVIRAFERFPEPFNLVTDSAYVAGGGIQSRSGHTAGSV
ncbi:hypothetical protein DUI87_06606 [Hirundo rustica rustica]|uniref:RNase H type-1 domain-containing protein n=1 Tax=Hirundo rustica rustica TaxID=333673 RepID=A0A3M0LBU6_HIRRU|nr:hypothetical protein DUI87_06606 [Hirundo rustica rustica]